MTKELLSLLGKNPVGNIILLYLGILWLYKPPPEEEL